eukprot:TRINITY_DN8949_c0_g1_i6.p1 TRINITY_DN8949_c0_g1~~TRINITY_DN8949_c0_g1_i6.p1  ORF type:complete len:235 (+),score=81.33 TRINITY_DN8949_c0_g1_i6:54-758(+)
MADGLGFPQIKLLYSRLKSMVTQTLKDGESKFTKRRLLQDIGYLDKQLDGLLGGLTGDDAALGSEIKAFATEAIADLNRQVQEDQSSHLRRRRQVVKEHYQPAAPASTTKAELAARHDAEGATAVARSGLRSALLDNKGTTMSAEELQDELTQDMLGLAQQMKQQAAATNDLIKTGNEDIDAAIEEADKSADNLGVALNIMGEQLDKQGGLWAWVLMLFALVMFVIMVVFLKLV